MSESQPVYATVAPVLDDSRARLGYDFLRLLAQEASFACVRVRQHPDGNGVDARIEVREQLDPEARSGNFTLDFQLRATCRKLQVVDHKLVFPLEIERYDLLRSANGDRPVFIVLLNLPTDYDGSDALLAEDLVVNRLGRWLCLSGAPQSSNTAMTPVRFPTWNVLTPCALREIARRVSIGSRFFHEQ
jgi:Domain of unknown function (DUF4365)